MRQSPKPKPSQKNKSLPLKPRVETPPPITHAEQKKQIGDALAEAKAAGLPSAAAMKAMWTLACTFFESGMFKDCGSPAGCFVKIAYGHEINITPMQAMTNIDIIEGKPAMSGQLMAAKFIENGGVIKTIERSTTISRVELTWRGRSQEFTFNIEDANTAELRGKNVHRKYPRVMLYWRNISEAIRVIAPDALLKVYTHGELTNDMAQNHEEYLALPAGAFEYNGHKPLDKRNEIKPSADRQSAPQMKVVIAPLEKITKLLEFIDSPACPSPFSKFCHDWVKKHNDTWADASVNKLLVKAESFSWKQPKEEWKQPTEKQITFVHQLMKSSKVPVIIVDDIHIRLSQCQNDKTCGFTSRQCGAWISCCSWYINEAEKFEASMAGNGKHEAGESSGVTIPPDSSDQTGSSAGHVAGQTEELKQPSDLAIFLNDIRTEMARRTPPSKKDLTAIQSWLDNDNLLEPKTTAEAQGFLRTIETYWPLKGSNAS